MPKSKNSAQTTLGPLPKPGILQIEPYVAGGSKLEGANRVFKLSSNETPFGPSPAAIEAYTQAGGTLELYPDGHGADLKEALGKTHGLDPANLVVGAGSDEVLSLLTQAYVGAGEEAVMTEHSFLVYRLATLANNAVPVFAPEPNDTADVDELLACVGPRTRVVFLANPSNPKGTYIPKSEIERLHAGLPESVLLILDAAYAEYVTAPDYDDGSALAASAPNVVMTRTFSKIYGLAALRLGWALTPPAIGNVFNRIRGPFNTSTAAQAAGLAALKDQAHIDQARRHNDAWLSKLPAQITDMGLTVVPSVANFVLVHFDAFGPDAATKADKALKAGGVIVRDLKNYGIPNSLRITIGTDEANERMLDLLSSWTQGQK